MLTKEFTLTELSSTAAFKTFVSDVGGNPNGVVACLKGYGSGMEANQKEYIEAALNALAPVDVLVFDGDWLKEGSFTAVVPAFLAAKPNARGIAFRKPTAAGHKFFETWEVPEVKDIVKGKIGLIQVPPEALEKAMRELSSLGALKEEDLPNTALGWLTINFTKCSSVLSIGGGLTCVNEAKACAAARKRDGASALPPWTLLDIGRMTKDGPQRPTELMTLQEQLKPSPSSSRSATLSISLSGVEGLEGVEGGSAYTRLSLKQPHRMRFLKSTRIVHTPRPARPHEKPACWEKEESMPSCAGGLVITHHTFCSPLPFHARAASERQRLRPLQRGPRV